MRLCNLFPPTSSKPGIHHCGIETLEQRIAPASTAGGSILLNGPSLPIEGSQDPEPYILNIEDGQAYEGGRDGYGSDIGFRLVLNRPAEFGFQVAYETVSGTAVAGEDFRTTTGYADVLPGATFAFIGVDVLNDSTPESVETFSVRLTTVYAPDVLIGDAEATGTIYNDDDALPSDFFINRSRTVATWTDADGDHVTLRVNKRVLDVDDFRFLDNGHGSVLARLWLMRDSDDLYTAGFAVSLTAKKGTGGNGDGYADVGYLSISGQAVSIIVDGTLGTLVAGERLRGVQGIGTLKVGEFGGEFVDSGNSFISGGIRLMEVERNWNGGKMEAEFIQTVRVGGSILGESTESPAKLHAHTRIGTMSVEGSVENTNIIIGGGSALAIGKLSVKGHWQGSSLSAGRSFGLDGFFGTDDDGQHDDGNIGRVELGSLVGTAAEGDHFGIVGTRIAAVIIGGNPVRLSSDTDYLQLPGADDLVFAERILP